MGKWVDNRESEIGDLIWDGIDNILDEIAPVLNIENGAFSSATNYKNTLRGKIHTKLYDQIYPNINKQLDGVEEDINTCIDVEVDKAITKENEAFIKMENAYDAIIAELKEKIEDLEEENRLFREGRAGTVHGKQFGI